LVAECKDFDFLGTVAAPEQDQNLEDAAKDDVQRGPGHE
jgi:hypothetical protein